MPTIKIHRNHDHSDEDVRQIAEDLATDLNEQYGLDSNWQGDTVHFKRSGLSGSLDLKPGKVAIELKLGMMMSAFAGKIEKEVNKALDKKLA